MRKQIYIFDLDGTLYSRNSKLYKIMSYSIKNWFEKHLSLNKKDFIIYYEKMKNQYPNPLDAVQAHGFDISLYQNEIFNNISKEYYLLTNVETKNILHELTGIKFIVTLSLKSHAQKVLEELQISQYFSEIYTPRTNSWHTQQKIDAYELIRNQYQLKPKEIYIVGDNYFVDLAIASKEGYTCILLSDDKESKNIKNIYTIKSLKSLLALKIKKAV